MLYKKMWDRLFLKTTHVAFFLLAIKFFLDGRWGLGIFLISATLFGIGGIGQALYPNLSMKELALGGMKIRPDDYKSAEYLDSEDSHDIAQAMMRLALLIFVVVAVISFFTNQSFLKTAIFAISFGVAMPILTFLFFGLYGWINRRHKKIGQR